MFLQHIMLNLRNATAGALDRPANLIWFAAAAVVAPFGLVVFGGSESNNLPWYFWALILFLLFAVVGVAFLRFTGKRRESDLSIKPKAH